MLRVTGILFDSRDSGEFQKMVCCLRRSRWSKNPFSNPLPLPELIMYHLSLLRSVIICIQCNVALGQHNSGYYQPHGLTEQQCLVQKLTVAHAIFTLCAWLSITSWWYLQMICNLSDDRETN